MDFYLSIEPLSDFNYLSIGYISFWKEFLIPLNCCYIYL